MYTIRVSRINFALYYPKEIHEFSPFSMWLLLLSDSFGLSNSLSSVCLGYIFKSSLVKKLRGDLSNFEIFILEFLHYTTLSS